MLPSAFSRLNSRPVSMGAMPKVGVPGGLKVALIAVGVVLAISVVVAATMGITPTVTPQELEIKL